MEYGLSFNCCLPKASGEKSYCTKWVALITKNSSPSSFDLCVPTILCSWVIIPSTPSTLLYSQNFVLYCHCIQKRTKLNKRRPSLAHIYKTPLPRYVRVSLFAKVWLSHRQMSGFYCNIKFLYKLEAFGDIKIENRFCTTYFISFDFSLFLDVSVS